MFSSRTGRLAALSMAAAALLSGCGGARPAAATDGGTVTVAFSNQPRSLDPAFRTQLSSDRNVLNLCFDTLLSLGASGTVSKNLADYTLSPDGLTLTLTLVDGVTFHDGSPLTADAVAANITRTMNPAVQAPTASAFSSVGKVAVTGPGTVVLTLKKPDAVLLKQLASEPGMMSAPAALQDENYGSTGAVGTGPFICDDWKRGVSLTARRNPAYWKKGPDGRQLPYLDRVVYRFITDDKTTESELRSGGVDLAFTLPPASFDALRRDPKVAGDDVGRNRSWWLALNNGGKFSDERVRKALQLAVDPRQIGEVTAAGEYVLSPTFATRADPFYSPAITVPNRDPQAARRLLAEAGHPDGLDVNLMLRTRQIDQQIATLLQSQLKEAGFTATIRTGELAKVLEDAANGNYDIYEGVIDTPRIDGSLVWNQYFGTGAPSNWSAVSDPVIDNALTAAQDAADPKQSAAQYVAVQKQIVDRAYAVFLHQQKSPVFHLKTLSGLTYDPDGQWSLAQARTARS